MVADDNPTLHEDAQRLPSEAPDDLPPLIPSTNPLFPNAIVKKPPNTHAKSSQSKMSQGSEKKAPSTPKVVLGKNAPVCLPFFRIQGGDERLMRVSSRRHVL